MADEDAFDPFHLNSRSEGSSKRPVVISVSQGTSDPGETNDTTNADSFDPFGITQEKGSPKEAPPHPDDEQDDGSNSSPSPPPQVSRVTRTAMNLDATSSVPLPPKLLVKLTIQEEVTSVALTGPEHEGSSDVSVEGSIHAQVQCSDASKNAPFALATSPVEGARIHIRPNRMFATVSPANSLYFVRIPKPEIGMVLIAHYSLQEQVQHMPILLERKVTMHDTSCRVAIQVRSKLTNKANMEDFTIAVAVPERVDGDSLEILKGDGVYDSLKRTIRWKLASLTKGESFMVSAQAKLWNAVDSEEEIRFPVLLRCTSSGDKISSVNFSAKEVEDNPASITCHVSHSFRLMHRLT